MNYSYSLYCVLILLLTFACKTPNKAQETGETRKPNKLINERSPYLLQHAYNPVDWHPWGDDALKKAKDENKMIIISVGYSACHWCHVMEHESFEDSTVAQLMNDHFVAIKVDREERPDIDDVYMTACHLTSRGSCGWPLNAIALPDGKPFFAGTYFPKKQWLDLLSNIKNTYKNAPNKLEEAAKNITEGIQNSETINYYDRDANYTRKELDDFSNVFINAIDLQKGGRKANPQRPTKFPMPSNYEYLLEYHELTGNATALKAVNVTLENMAFGGIYDQLGGGFARYSTDMNWKVPHFEKMLYDNSQLVSLYSHAYQKTKNPLYKQVVYETLAFIDRELTAPEGGFYSSLDADSEGVEGKFYVFTMDEMTAAVGEADSKVFANYYSMTEHGNWEESNILFRTKSDEEIAKKHAISVEELKQIIDKSKTKLMKARDKRIRPGLDDKILTSWNGLMLKGYVDAYRAFGEQRFLDAALKNAEFLMNTALQKDNRLNRNYKDGESGINAFLDDYAILAEALISLYQATFDEQWLNKARDLTDFATAHFYDNKTKMYFYTSNNDKPLIARKKETSDNVIPASNSIMARNLYNLGLYYYKEEYKEMSSKMLITIVEKLQNVNQPTFYSNWLRLYNTFVKPPYEVAIVGKDFAKKRVEIDQKYLPFAILLGGKDEGTLELLEDKLVKDETTIYVCRNKTCKLPTSDVNKALLLMK